MPEIKIARLQLRVKRNNPALAVRNGLTGMDQMGRLVMEHLAASPAVPAAPGQAGPRHVDQIDAGKMRMTPDWQRDAAAQIAAAIREMMETRHE
jgi:hypothetical protein